MTTATSAALKLFLSRLLSRSLLSDDEQKAVLRLRTRRADYSANRDIVSPAQTVDHACLVAGGVVARFDQMHDGRRQITSFFLSGDMCDLHSVVAPKATWSMTALSHATVLQIPHDDLRRVALEYPALAFAFWRDCTVDSSILAKWVGNLGRKNSLGRISHVLCEVALRMENADLGSRCLFQLPISQEQLADAGGMTAVHVNRTLQELRRRNLIRFKSGVVEIVDWDAIVELSDFDPAYLMLNEPLTRAAVVRPTVSVSGQL